MPSAPFLFCFNTIWILLFPFALKLLFYLVLVTRVEASPSELRCKDTAFFDPCFCEGKADVKAWFRKTSILLLKNYRKASFQLVMIVLTSWKEAHSTYCLIMAQYCPLLGQLFAIARHKMMRREKNFGRSTIAIRNMLSGCWKRGFAREKPYSQIYPSPFTFSQETPINTGVVRGEGLAQPFTHPSPTLHLFEKNSSKRFQDARLLIIGEPIRGLLITKLIHHLCIELVIIDDRTVV